MGISLGALWWTAGMSALLAQIPLLGRVGALPGLARIRSGLAGSATAVASVTALVVAGAVGGGGGGQPAVSRQGVQAAAPAPPPAVPSAAAVPSAPSAAAPAVPAVTTVTGPRTARPVRPPPSIDDLLKGVATTVTTAPPSSAPPPAPAPVTTPPAPAPAPATFTAHGQLLAPDLLGRLGIGLTNRGPTGGCGPSASQGLDAWVFQLPEGAGAPSAGAPVKATGSDLLGLHNLSVTFVGPDCAIVGQLDTPEPDEAGVLPPGTRFVVVSDRSGVGTAVTLSVG
jgi:hypothetical protein